MLSAYILLTFLNIQLLVVNNSADMCQNQHNLGGCALYNHDTGKRTVVVGFNSKDMTHTIDHEIGHFRFNNNRYLTEEIKKENAGQIIKEDGATWHKADYSNYTQGQINEVIAERYAQFKKGNCPNKNLCEYYLDKDIKIKKLIDFYN